VVFEIEDVNNLTAQIHDVDYKIGNLHRLKILHKLQCSENLIADLLHNTCSVITMVIDACCADVPTSEQQQSTSAAGAVSETPATQTTTESPLKCPKSPKKTAAQTEPEWFTRFAAQQQKVNEDLIKLNKEVLQVAKDRNEILKSLVDALKK